ncbi:FAD-binding oxidoreductase [Thalassotalea piscium]
MTIPQDLKKNYTDIVGADNVTDDLLEREYFSHDVFSIDSLAAVVVSPENAEQLSKVVAESFKHKRQMSVRGGGMSYSSGYTPTSDDVTLLDLSRMNRVLEINQQDMYVTVESGISWSKLHETLKEYGLRTPYWGTLSGINASVGGSISQNSIFWGSGEYGSSADSVLSLEVVLSDGKIIKTGSASKADTLPFFRHYGPDLTGLFTGDCGALGFKAAVTLRLIPEYEARAYGSFSFTNEQDMLEAMTSISRKNLAKECFGFDPYLQEQRMKRESLSRDASQLLGVLKNSGGLKEGMKNSIGLALSGRRFMKEVSWSFNVIVEERTKNSAQDALNKILDIIKLNNGTILADSIPKLIRSNPFGPVNNMVGPNGERWVPVHGLVPHSKSLEIFKKLNDLFASHQQTIDKYNIGVGYLFSTVSTTCTVIEPVFFWPDQLEEIHKRSLEPAHLKNLKGFKADEDARDAVKTIRQEVAKLFLASGSVNLQIGKSYPYKSEIAPANFGLLSLIKSHLDPHNLVNPGVLGLN